MPSVEEKLQLWAAAPGREVRRSTRGAEHLCECTEGGAVVVVGVGDSPEAAAKDAGGKLWALALEATSKPTNPRAKWRK